MNLKNAKKIVVHDTGRSALSMLVLAVLMLIAGALISTFVFNVFASPYFWLAVTAASYLGATRVYIITYLDDKGAFNEGRIFVGKLAEIQHAGDVEVVINR